MSKTRAQIGIHDSSNSDIDDGQKTDNSVQKVGSSKSIKSELFNFFENFVSKAFREIRNASGRHLIG